MDVHVMDAVTIVVRLVHHTGRFGRWQDKGYCLYSSGG